MKTEGADKNNKCGNQRASVANDYSDNVIIKLLEGSNVIALKWRINTVRPR